MKRKYKTTKSRKENKKKEKDQDINEGSVEVKKNNNNPEYKIINGEKWKRKERHAKSEDIRRKNKIITEKNINKQCKTQRNRKKEGKRYIKNSARR